MPIADTRNQDLQQVAGTDLVGPDSKPTEQMDSAASMAVPLERQISFKFPTVITPSEQAEDVRHIQTGEDGVTEQVLTAKQAATAYAGELCHEVLPLLRSVAEHRVDDSCALPHAHVLMQQILLDLLWVSSVVLLVHCKGMCIHEACGVITNCGCQA